MLDIFNYLPKTFMKISLKRYQQIRIGIMIIIAIVVSQSLMFENYFIPIITIIIWWLALFLLRSKVKEIIADERDYAIAGNAATLTIKIFSFAAAIMIFVFYAMKQVNPSYETIAITLSITVCILMLLYSCIFTYLHKDKKIDKKFILIFLLLLVACIAALRILSWEDNRICKDGNWQKHGNPDFPKPTMTCQK